MRRKTTVKEEKSADYIAETKKEMYTYIQELRKSDKRDKPKIARKENDLVTS